MNEFNLPEPKRNKLLAISMHIFVFVCIIGFQTLIILSIGATISWKGCLFFLLQIILFYLCQYWVIPKVFTKNNRRTFLFRLSFLILGYIVVRGIIILPPKKIGTFLNFLLSFEQVIYASAQLVLVLGLSFFMGLYRHNEDLRQDYVKAIRSKLEAEAERLRIENIAFQMKLSPHLLFNSLSHIKMLGSEAVPEIGKVVDLISGILRHSLIDILNVKKVPLSKEIAALKNQIELHRELADGNVYIDFVEHYHRASNEAMVPPATLLTLFENVFRYGIVNDHDFPASVIIKIDGNHFTFSTWNYKRLNSQSGTGLGIKSVASTLGYYYPGLHALAIEDLEDSFSLKLTIQL